jgi:hypothetical protein
MPGYSSVKVGFAFHHLQAAAMYALEVHRIENQHAGQPRGDFFNEIIWQASTSIIMSLAALEGNINEIIDDVAETHGGRIGAQCRALVNERRRILENTQSFRSYWIRNLIDALTNGRVSNSLMSLGTSWCTLLRNGVAKMDLIATCLENSQEKSRQASLFLHLNSHRSS